ncbi:RNA exonuclease 3 [Pyrenophora tritici-repentis Pt-1C-BFP]|uniref:RNA exonuclease 3 n=1 Tax=Pyrenophora tritici-repentis (strain Pt-1C-BFP) TaxID=426418 RepID=B2VXW7_PYRTR|nr:RNA exonuclease 3 [Pyrenophora tritici-repentis Pt-1C-BFP]EDU45886.1 RNA exonuclease 3 [Pyrenophora tritici-repentis Pt-1C-BFP]
MGDLDELFEKGKTLTTAKTKELLDTERGWCDEAQANPVSAAYYEVLCRMYLSGKESSAALGHKMKYWQWQRDEEKKKLDRDRLDKEKAENKKLDDDKLDNGKLDTGKLDTGKLDTGKLDTGKLDDTKLNNTKLDNTKLDNTKLDNTKLLDDGKKLGDGKKRKKRKKRKKLEDGKKLDTTTTESKARNPRNNVLSTLSITTEAQEPLEACPLPDPRYSLPGLKFYPPQDPAIKREADEEAEKVRKAKRLVRRNNPPGTRRKKCGLFRSDENIVKRKTAGRGIEHHPPVEAKFDLDRKCKCHRWNRVPTKICFKCGRPDAEGWEYTAHNGVDGVLPPFPGYAPDCPPEAAKRGMFFATHPGPWRPLFTPTLFFLNYLQRCDLITSFDTMNFSSGSQWIPNPPVPRPHQGFAPCPVSYPPDAAYMSELYSFLEPADIMEKNGYVLQELTDIDLNQKRRCKNCNQTVQYLTKSLQKTTSFRAANHPPNDSLGSYHRLPTIRIPQEEGYMDVDCTKPCMYHPGDYVKASQCYNCCNSHVSASVKYCVTTQRHTLRKYKQSDLDRIYQFHMTPPVYAGQNRTPRAAVAIDCEMGTAKLGDSELIRISAIDYFTGEVLVNNLVEPDLPMQSLNTQYSGVTFDQLNHAVLVGHSLKGKVGAREALWRFVGPETFIVGHGVNNDLRALRMIHPRVVDSYMVENKIVQARKAIEAAAAAAEAEREAALSAQQQLQGVAVLPQGMGVGGWGVSSSTLNNQAAPFATAASQVEPKKKKKPKGSGELSLKMLLKRYLGREIQMQGNLGHDSMEDAIAARDLVHWMVQRRLNESVQTIWGSGYEQ